MLEVKEEPVTQFSADAKKSSCGPARPCSPIVANFLQDLTEIANKHGLGINDNAELFVMVGEDFEFRYALDQNGRLGRL